MILGLIVYVVLLFYMWSCSLATIHINGSSYYNITTILPLLVASIVLGCRYDVGVDYMVYYEYYNDIQNGLNIKQFELGYRWLNQLCAWLVLPNSAVFIISSFLQLFFYYYTFRYNRELLPYAVIVLFLTGQLFFHLNIVRHGISAMIFLASIRYAVRKEFWNYFFMIILAGLFHTSSFFLLPLYWVCNLDCRMFRSKTLIVGLLITSSIFSHVFLSSSMNTIIWLLEKLGYVQYIYIIEDWEMGVASGLGILLKNVLDIVTIVCSINIAKERRDKYLVAFCNIFIIGLILNNLVGLNLVLSRVPFALVSARCFVLAYVLWYYQARCTLRRRVVLCVLYVGYILLFVNDIVTGSSQCTPFQII